MKIFLLFVFLLIPFISISQISIPSWVEDIGGPGSSSSIPASVKIDKQNNIYVVGIYSGTVDFDPSAAVFNLTSINGSFDTYVAKYTTAGKLIWAISIGGSGTDQANNMTLDDNGNPSIIGQYDSPTLDADPGAGVFNLQNNGGKDAFIVHLDTNGKFLWATSLGGGGDDYGDRIAADHSGNVIAVFQYESTITAGGKTFSSGGVSFNGLMIKYDVNGNFIWAINWSDTGDSEGRSLAVDLNNNIAVTGVFGNNVNFNPMGAAHMLNGNGSSSFLAKYTASGVLTWVQQVNGTIINHNLDICLDSKGDVFLDGPFGSTLTFNAGNNLSPVSTEDIFLAKYDPNGVFQEVKDIGGASSTLYNYGISASLDDYIYLSGYFSGTIDFDPSPTSTALIKDHGVRDLFLSKYDNNLNYKWAFGAGNNVCNNTLGRNLAVDGANNVILVGSFCSTVNFDASGCTTYSLTSQSDIRDSFIAKYIQGAATPTAQITAFSVPQQSSPAVIDQTNLKITLTIPAGTDVSTLVPTIAVSSGQTLKPASGVAQNFSSPVTYNLSTKCTSLNYSVSVAFTEKYKTDTVCVGAADTIAGDIEKIGVPITSYTWQVLTNGNWVTAPGKAGIVYYVTSALANTTGTAITYSLRRQLVLQDGNNDMVYDSFTNVTVEPIVAISNNIITPPTVTWFCLIGIPATIIGNNPTGGTGTYKFQWQSSTDNVTFTNVTGAVLKDLIPKQISTTTYYHRLVTSGACNTPVLSNVVVLTVSPGITNNIITAPAITTICSKSAPGTITGDIPSGGNGGYIYQWQQSTDNVNFTDIPGAALQNLDPGTLTVTTYFRRAASTATCTTPVVSNVITVTVLPVITNNIITAPAVTNFCLTGNADAITGTAPDGGSGNYTYQWQSAADGINFTDIPGANAINLDPPVITQTTYYRRAVTSAVCSVPSLSNNIAINIETPPAAPVAVPAIVLICPGSTAKLSVSVVQNETYNWYDSPSKAKLLFTGDVYTTGVLITSQTFYVEAINSTCASLSLTSVQVNISPLPAAPQLVRNAISACENTLETLNILNPQTGYTYNWYTTPSGGSAIFTGVNFVTDALNASVIYYAEAVNDLGCSSSSRTPANINVIAAPGITTQGVSICPGSSATLTASSTDQNAVINWYADATGGSILFTGANFVTPATNTATNYYAEAVDKTNGCISLTRAPAPVNITSPLAAPQVTVASVTASSITFQWNAVTGATGYQVSADNGATFTTPTSGGDGLTDIVSGLQPLQSVSLIVVATGSQSCQLSANSVAVTGTTISPLGNYIYVPNAFTPNGDGKNDIVYVHSENIKSLKFYIYDQWGEMLYNSLSQQNGWDGTYRGTKEPVGVYVYYLEAVMNDGQQINKKGTITLLR